MLAEGGQTPFESIVIFLRRYITDVVYILLIETIIGKMRKLMKFIVILIRLACKSSKAFFENINS